ncbi:MAG: hypothetical protein BJ554DRAFT_4150, partial [Olpidium bornovanus]
RNQKKKKKKKKKKKFPRGFPPEGPLPARNGTGASSSPRTCASDGSEGIDRRRRGREAGNGMLPAEPQAQLGNTKDRKESLKRARETLGYAFSLPLGHHHLSPSPPVDHADEVSRLAATDAASENVISVVTRDNIRTLKAHTGSAANAAKSAAVLINPKDLERVRNAAKVLTPDDIQAQAVQLARERAAAAEQSRARKLKMEELELKRTANAKLSEAEIEAKNQNNCLLAKAMMQIEEEEDEIKHM